jgi:hypothetical protein
MAFEPFKEEKGLVELGRNGKKSIVEIRAEGARWIDGKKTHGSMSKVMQDLINEGRWDKRLFIWPGGDVFVRSGFHMFYSKLVAFRKDSDFRNLLQLGWKGIGTLTPLW